MHIQGKGSSTTSTAELMWQTNFTSSLYISRILRQCSWALHSTDTLCFVTGYVENDILRQHGGPILKGHILWRLDNHAVLKHQPPDIQWCSAISQQKRIFNNLLLLLLSQAVTQVSSLYLHWEKLQSLNSKFINIFFYVLLTVHLSITLEINQLNAQILVL
jgi:hypothetical protein